MIETIRYLAPYLRRYKAKYIAGALFLVCTNAFRISNPRVVQNAIDYLTENFVFSQLAIFSALIVLIAIGEGIFSFLMRRSMIVASREVENDIRNDFFERLSMLDAAFYHRVNTGDIMSRATSDLTAVRMMLGPGIAYSTNTIFAFLFIIPVMLTISPWLTLWVLLPIPVVAVLVNRFGKAIYVRFEKIQRQLGVLSTRAQENIAGQTMIKWYARENHEVEQFRQENEIYMQRTIDYAKVDAAFRPSLMMTIGFSTALLIWVGGNLAITGAISIGELTAFILYMGILVWPAIALGWVIGIFQQGSASMQRMRLVLDAEPEIRVAANPQTPETFEGKISIRGLTFAYDGYDPCLNDINLEIEPRKTLGIIGPTGCGKSTLIKLLAHLYKVENQTLFIDGIDLNDLALESLRKAIGYVPQETFLFSDSIFNNIAYGYPNATQEEVEKAARLADIHDQIMGFTDQYEAMLGEKGINLSGGQKQRISIARAILKDPAILILDDAFSALDTRTEDRILKGLETIFTDRTVILVSHRVSTLQNADKIIVMDEGRIIEEGLHDELIQREGLYHWIYEKQLLEEELAHSD